MLSVSLGVWSARRLPLLPLAAFLLFLDAGYLLMFTAAGGQTIGKMARAYTGRRHVAWGRHQRRDHRSVKP